MQPRIVSSMLVPVMCERCGAWKKGENGQSLYVAIAWRRGKRMVCPTCFEVEQTMAAMEKVVSWDDEDDDVPF